MRRVLMTALIALGLLSPVAAESQGVGSGDFEFFVDVAGFRAADGSTDEEIYVRIPHVEVKFNEVDGRLQGEVRVQLRVENDQGERVVDEQETVRLYASSREEADNPLFYQDVIRRYPLAPGRYRLSCVIHDAYSPKVTVVGLVRGEVKTARLLDFPIEVPDLSGDGVLVSDAKFLWDVEQRMDGDVQHPNPARLYGLYRDSLQVYVELYAPLALAPGTSGAGESRLDVETDILDVDGELVQRSVSTLPAPVPGSGARVVGDMAVYPIVIREDLNRFPAGSYTLYVNVASQDQLRIRVRGGSFSVAWDMRSWEISRRNLVAEARFLLDPEDFVGFREKSIGEQEKVLSAMWKEADPDPTTGVNEGYEEFLERLAWVNDRYADYDMGFMTDRGLVYLRYGPPDELIADVIPLNRESLSDALQKIEDRFHAVNFSNTGGRVGYAQPSKSIIIDPRRLGAVGEGGDTAVPYELWVYNGKGDPILERDASLEPNIGLRFIFVDREGYGRYKLESSSSMANK